MISKLTTAGKLIYRYGEIQLHLHDRINGKIPYLQSLKSSGSRFFLWLRILGLHCFFNIGCGHLHPLGLLHIVTDHCCLSSLPGICASVGKTAKIRDTDGVTWLFLTDLLVACFVDNYASVVAHQKTQK
jgi:hypothetical protein